MADFGSQAPTIPPPTSTPVLVVSASPSDLPNDPPPPYPSRERHRRSGQSGRSGRRRRTVGGIDSEHLQVPSSATEPDSLADAASPPGIPHSLNLDYELDDQLNTSETTPLLPSPRLPPGSISTREHRTRTLSISSGTSLAPSFAQTVLSALHPDRDYDLDPDEGTSDSEEDGIHPDSSTPRGNYDAYQPQPFASRQSPVSHGTNRQAQLGRWRRYFRPLTRRAYYSAMFHLLIVNFPYALAAWVYLFVFTLTGTTTLVALPLGALLCFLDLLGARAFSRGELYLQTTFHGPLAFHVPYPAIPLFTRIHMPTSAELETGLGPYKEHSFYRNAYSMFTDATSYQALFYFLVIKPAITLLLLLLLVIFVPISFALIFPAPALLRLIRRIGIWQANIAVEGLCYGTR